MRAERRSKKRTREQAFGEAEARKSLEEATPKHAKRRKLGTALTDYVEFLK